MCTVPPSPILFFMRQRAPQIIGERRDDGIQMAGEQQGQTYIIRAMAMRDEKKAGEQCQKHKQRIHTRFGGEIDKGGRDRNERGGDEASSRIGEFFSNQSNQWNGCNAKRKSRQPHNPFGVRQQMRPWPHDDGPEWRVGVLARKAQHLKKRQFREFQREQFVKPKTSARDEKNAARNRAEDGYDK